MARCIITRIKCCIFHLLGGMWIQLNVMNLRKLKKFMDRLSDLNVQELFVFTKLLSREIL